MRTSDGWLYLATVINLASRRVLAFAMPDHMRTELVTEALEMAIEQRHPMPGSIFHSDSGSLHLGKYTNLLKASKIIQSSSRPVNSGQRRGGKLVRHPQRRAHLPQRVADSGPRPTGQFRVHRRVSY
jgi:transposase InsO family protein